MSLLLHCYHIATLRANKALNRVMDMDSNMQDIRG